MIFPVHGLEAAVGERGRGAVCLRLRDPSIDEVVDHEGSCACDPCRADRTDCHLDNESPAKSTGGDEAMIEVFGGNAPVHLDS